MSGENVESRFILLSFSEFLVWPKVFKLSRFYRSPLIGQNIHQCISQRVILAIVTDDKSLFVPETKVAFCERRIKRHISNATRSSQKNCRLSMRNRSMDDDDQLGIDLINIFSADFLMPKNYKHKM